MKCKKTDSTIIGYLFKALSPDAEKRFDKHLRACDECRERLARFKRTQKLLDGLHAPQPSEDLTHRIMHTIGEDSRKTAADIAPDDYVEALGKTAGSELMRVYAFLTRHLGLEKGEAAFDEYLQEQMQLRFSTGTGSVITYENLINTATGERSVTKTEGQATCSTVENCSFPSLAEEIGISTNPCATICRRQIKIIEKMRSVEIKCTKHRTHKKGGCEFLIKPAEKDS
jgi:hypothetical protein